MLENAEMTDPFDKGKRLVRATLFEKSGLGKRYRGLELSGFEPKKTQLKAFESAKSFCENYITGKNHGEGLIFAGNCGSGKTMLAAAIAGELINRVELDETRVGMAVMLNSDQWDTKKVLIKFTNVVTMLDRLRCSYDKFDPEGNSRAIIGEFETAPLLILDDLGAEKPTGWSAERLYELINYRYMEALPIIVTTNCTPDELKARLDERLFDRIRAMCAYNALTSERSMRISAEI